MKARLLIAISLLALLSVPVGMVMADNGPHGGYTATTDACAGCHRTHTASAPNLLLNTVPGLCYTCHGSAATGADTNVVDGIYLERDFVTEFPAEGMVNRGLKGGGFSNALMDTDSDAVFVSTAVTSSHDGSTPTIWGNGAIGSGPGTGAALSCVSCHDPHGSGAYRSLRPVPTGSGAAETVSVTDEAAKNYTIASSAGNYADENYNTISTQMTDWCSQCHTRYKAASGSGHTDSGDAIFAYRHATDNVSCVRCHVAHGTSATMTPLAGTRVQFPDGATAASDNGRSSLLRLDNRLICYACHVNSSGTVDNSLCVACHNQPLSARRQIIGAGADFELTSHHVNGIVQNDDCIVCHNNNSHQSGTVNLLNVDNGSAIIYDNTPASLEPFCLACHDGNGAGGFSPFSDAIMPPVVDQTAWNAASHQNITSCSGCHTNGHGSNKVSILDPWDAAASGAVPGDPMLEEEGFCYRCHGASGPAAVDIQAQFAQPSHHNISVVDPDGEYMECTTCHNPHLANGANKLANPDTGAATLWAGSQEDFCQTCHDGVPPGGITFPGTTNCTGYDKSTFVGSTHDNIASGPAGTTDSCRACHDQHGSPNLSTLLTNYDLAARGPSNDKSITFQMRNDAAGAVTIDTMRVAWDAGGGAGIKDVKIDNNSVWKAGPDPSGTLLNINPNETMNSGDVRVVELKFDGVTSSANGWVQFNTTGGETCYITFGTGVAPVPGNPCQIVAAGTPIVGLYTDYTTDYALCWTCHDANNVLFADNVFGEHEKHVIKEGASCIMCHDAHAPHQGGEDGLINFEFAINNGYDISYIAGNMGTTAYQPGSCYINCHGKLHDPKTY